MQSERHSKIGNEISDKIMKQNYYKYYYKIQIPVAIHWFHSVNVNIKLQL